MGVRPNLPWVSPVLSSLVYFSITLYFALNESKVVDKIGKILTQFLITTLLLIIFKGIFTPLASPVLGSLSNPFSSGFREGYQAMDAMASIGFAIFALPLRLYPDRDYCQLGSRRCQEICSRIS